uniref:Alkylglycerol monooxygenase n=1 Tax=Timema shepardi TaxID=629360 RepID=A0A7R9FUV4_TIMSH|nr:unnamed protein product [Timema shepardi]
MLINETLNVGFGADSSRDILRGLAQMFYMVSPQETTFEEPEEVPKYFRQSQYCESNSALSLSLPGSLVLLPTPSYMRMRTAVKHHVASTVKRTVPYKDFFLPTTDVGNALHAREDISGRTSSCDMILYKEGGPGMSPGPWGDISNICYRKNCNEIHWTADDGEIWAWPYFLAFLVVENVLLWMEEKTLIRFNDGITSLSHGVFLECGSHDQSIDHGGERRRAWQVDCYCDTCHDDLAGLSVDLCCLSRVSTEEDFFSTGIRKVLLVFRGAENVAYIFIYENFRLVELPWDSAWTWYLAVVGVDFCYYWLHRACHEVHILWAQHQVHHSSEEFNLTVGLRQSILQGWCGFLFYLPLAVIIPPAHFLTHQQFNLLFQFWIHTKSVHTLGPLEWVFNTPRHHRVHHAGPRTEGRGIRVSSPSYVKLILPQPVLPSPTNPGSIPPESHQSRCNLYCLDKNYGGLLIIWDRLFGTFADERPKEEIIYGLVYNQPSFNPFFLQIFYNMNVINKWKSMSNWQDKLAAVWKGPSWIPGKPRLGAEEDKLDIKSRDKYNVQLPLWCNLYLLIHFVVVVIGFQELALRYMGMSPLAVLGFVAYILTSLTTIGMLFDNHPYACLFELVRCLAFVCALYVSSTHINTKHCSSFKLDEKTRMKTRSAMGIQLACPQVVDAAQALKLG